MTTTPSTLRLVLIEGLFARDGADFPVQDDNLSRQLLPLIGEHVRLSAHHLPANPIDPTRWGGGSCDWQDSGSCPFGHHADPTRMFSYTGEGTLGRKRDGSWRLTTFDGQVVDPGFDSLRGHLGRVACVSVRDVERMRDVVLRGGADADLGVRAADLKNMLDRLRGTL